MILLSVALLGLLCAVLGFLTGIISLIGFAIKKINIPRKDSTFAGIFLPVFYILLFSMVFPATKKSHDYAIDIQCRNNLMHLSRGFLAHQEIENTWISNNWSEQVQLWVDINKKNANYLQCPADKTGPCSYAMNEGIPEEAGKLPDDLVVLFESAPGWNAVGGADDVVTDWHKRAGANIAFADGRVEFVEADAIPNLRWTVDDKSVERE